MPPEGLRGSGFIRQEMMVVMGDGGGVGEDSKCKGPEVMRNHKQAVEAYEPH